MGRASVEAANTFAMREWAAQAATKAPPKDYIGQLRELYDLILSRWRYVQETGEWVHAGADGILGIVLGLKYNLPEGADPKRATISRVPANQLGWGDCDDVSEVVAAGVLALGMRPLFRTVVGPRGGHVSVVAITPLGERVSLDPVGHPAHPFGWMMPANGKIETYWDTTAKVIPLHNSPEMQMSGDLGRCDMQSVNKTALLRAGRTSRKPIHIPTQVVEMRRGLFTPDVIAVRGGFLSGTEARDGLEGDDNHGQGWILDGVNQVWRSTEDIDDPEHLAGIADIRRRWKKRAKAVLKVGKKVHRLHNKVAAKALGSKVGRRLVGSVLTAYGVPPQATSAVMKAASSIIEQGGVIGFVRKLKKDPKFARQMIAKAVKDGLLASGMIPPRAKKLLSDIEEDEGEFYQMDLGCTTCVVAPLAAIVELAAVPAFEVANALPDQMAERINAKQAAIHRPTDWNGRRRKSGQSESDWLTNVVLWATYKNAPEKLSSKRSSDKPYIAAWIRIEKEVKAALAANPATPSKSIPLTTTKTTSTAGDLVSNAAKAIREKSSENDRANMTYWLTWPNSPTKIPKGDKTNANRWIQSGQNRGASAGRVHQEDDAHDQDDDADRRGRSGFKCREGDSRKIERKRPRKHDVLAHVAELAHKDPKRR